MSKREQWITEDVEAATASTPRKEKRAPAAIRWCFRKSATDQSNVQNNEEEGWRLHEAFLTHCTWATFQLESAPTTGYLHWQGSFHLINKNRVSWIHNTFGHMEFIQKQKGTNLQAHTYGSKEETRVLGPWFVGDVPPDVTQKRDYAQFIKDAENHNFDNIKNEQPAMYVLYYNTMKRISNDNPVRPPDISARCGEWFWGPPLGGKTTTARALSEQYGPFFDKRPNTNWDGYQGQKLVIVDDLDQSHKFLQRDLKIWGDKYAFQGRVLYSNIWLRPEKVVITSNNSIDQIFTDPEHAAAIRSRYPERYFPTISPVQGPPEAPLSHQNLYRTVNMDQ